jgi:hypothetical protein
MFLPCQTIPGLIPLPHASASKSAKDKLLGQPVGHSANNDAAASVVLAANEIIGLSPWQQLITKLPRDPRFAKPLNVILSRLNALALLATQADSSSWLLKKEYIAPNQHSWPETSTRMRVKRKKKKHCDSISR